MLDPSHPIVQLLQEDRRYRFDAYVLIFEALNYAHKVLGLGSTGVSEGEEDDPEDEARTSEKHLTGQQLCHAVRQYAIEQYGLMADCVLKRWGITSTSDFGEIVYNLIRIGQMRKTREDRREHFNNVFDFREAFDQGFKISVPEP